MADTYAEFVQMMRDQGAVNNGPSIELAVMTDQRAVRLARCSYQARIYIFRIVSCLQRVRGSKCRL